MHFPYCIKKCNYCDFFRSVNHQMNFELYHQLLEESQIKHVKLLDQYHSSMNKLKTFYLGGGTPSYWGQAGIIFLEKFFKKNKIIFEPDYEFTLEINPGSNLASDMAGWSDLGVNRYSVGIQSLNPFFLKILDRIHSKQDALQLIETLAKEKKSYSVDFILGLPYSQDHKRDICFELAEVLTFDPDHISMYILNVDKNYPYFNSLPEEEWIVDEYLLASSFLKNNGFVHYEVSNWAKKDKFSKHNLNYWKLGNWTALGPSASGNLFHGLNGEGIRYTWNNEKPSYYLEHLDNKKHKLEKLFMGLRTSYGIDPEDIFSKTELELFINIVGKWQKAGFANVAGRIVSLSDRGFLMLNSLLDEVFMKITTF